MIEETFVAPTPKEAYELAREKFRSCESLKLLRARQIRDRDDRLVAEITVALSEEEYLQSMGIGEEEELLREIESLKDRMHRLRSGLGALQSGARETAAKVIERFEARGMRREWLLRRIGELDDSEVLTDEAQLSSRLLEAVDEALQIVPEELDGRRVTMFVGPTGVGKTTTVAKLAARYSYMLQKDYRVALVNLDTFRTGAYEQLDSFARILGLEHRYVERVEEFGPILSQLQEYDMVLVDTAGISPYDTGRLIKTVEFLKGVDDREISTSLVLSATAKYEDMLEIYEHFSFIRPDRVVATKFDETRRIGDLISFLIERRLPVSYMSTGQRVPEDLRPASREDLLRALVEGGDV